VFPRCPPSEQRPPEASPAYQPLHGVCGLWVSCHHRNRAAPFLHGLDRLAVDDRERWIRTAPRFHADAPPQFVHDPLPQSAVPPAPKRHVHHQPRRKIVRQQAPLAPRALHITDCVADRSQAVFARSPFCFGSSSGSRICHSSSHKSAAYPMPIPTHVNVSTVESLKTEAL
jgi:hypothetical protein